MKTSIFVIFASLIFLWSCGSDQKEESEHEVLPASVVEMNDAQCKTAGIELGTVEYKKMNTSIRLNGKVIVSPQNLVSVSAIMGGYVKSTSLVQGSPVGRGQVIAVIENPDFIELQQEYLESESKLEYARAEYERQKSLNEENVNSKKTLQFATAEFRGLQSKVASLEKKLALIGINADKLNSQNISSAVAVVSPIAGYVKTVNVNTGKYVEPSDVIAEIVNTNSLMLELSVFEKNVYAISAGQNIDFSVPSHPSQIMTAVVSQVGKSINDDKTVKVYANVTGECKNLIPGMFVNAEVKSLSDSVMALPDEAVLTFDDKNYIFVFSERKKEGDKFVNLYKMIEVKIGVSDNGFTEVIFPEGFDLKKSRIVVKGAYNLLSALKNAGDMAC